MRLKEGDIFTIKVSDIRLGIGQIISMPNKGSLTVIIFDGLYDSNLLPDPIEVINNAILFLSNTLDAKFYHKNWVVYGNCQSNLKRIALPIYKLGTNDDLRYEDFFGKPIASSVIARMQKKNVTYRKYVAPVRVENALKAYYKLLPWNEEYDELLYKNIG